MHENQLKVEILIAVMTSIERGNPSSLDTDQFVRIP